MFSFHLPPPPTAPVLSCHVLSPCCFKKWSTVPIAYHVLDRDLPSLAFTDRKSSLPSPMLMWSGEDGMKDLLLPCSSPVKVSAPAATVTDHRKYTRTFPMSYTAH